jgi:PAS domain S-box-containing protein
MSITWAAVLGLATCILAGLGAYAWRHRATLGAASFGLLMFAVAGYSLTYALELLGRDLATKMLWIGAEYPFIVAIPVLWLIFALQYTGSRQWLSRRNIILLGLVPFLTVLLVWTNGGHHLYYSSTDIQDLGTWTLLQVQYGPWFWVHITFSYVCLAAGTLLLANAFLRGARLYRGQAAVLLVGALVPWLSNLLYLSRATPWPNLDLTPLAFTLSGLIVAYGLFRYRLLQIVPVARRAVVDGMPAAMLILDAKGQIADLNPAAQRLFRLGSRDVIGQPARQVLGPEEIVARYTGVPQADTDVEWGEGDERHVYRVTISPLGDDRAGTPARLVLVSDVTEHRRAQERLALTNRRLLALQESTAAFTALLDPASLFDRILEQLERVVEHEGAIVALLQDLKLEVVAARGFSDPAPVLGVRLEVKDESTFQQMAAEGRPLVIADVTHDPRWMWVDGTEFTRAWAGAPLQIKDEPIGLVAVFHSQAGVYSAEDGLTLQALARQAAVAIENAHLHEETHRWASQLRVLYEVATAAATAASLDETLQRTVRAVQQTMGPDSVGLLLLEPETSELVMRAWVGFPGGPTLMRRPIGVGVPGWVVQSGVAALIADVRQDPRYHTCDEDTRSELCVPLRMGPRIVGALNLESRQLAAFTELDLRLLTTLAGHLAAIIENARLSEEARDRAEALSQRSRQLELLHEIARVAASTLELPDLYQALADTLAQIIGGDGCYITRFDEATGHVSGGAAYGPFRDGYPGIEPPPGELTLTESVLKAGHPLAVDDVFNSPYMSPRIAEMFPARSQLGLPLRVAERTLGAVLIAFNEPHAFTNQEITLATQAVDLAAVALENARLYEEIRAWAARLEQRVETRTRELREAQAQLLHSEKLAALGQLSASVAHEIGHPLALIQGYVDLLAEDQPDQPFIPPVQDAIQQLTRMLNQLRDFSRPAIEEWSQVAINEVLGDVLTLVSKELDRSRVRVRQQMDTSLPQIRADARQFEQVFLNLVLNARDAMPQGGELTVRTFRTADQIAIEFADTGVGIPPENLQRIFEPYFTTKEDKGTGLGLAICERIVQAHAGWIEVSSEQGQGTVFRIHLPLEPPPLTHSVPEQP